ncbi:MAG TPA: hypothetical protein VMF32_26215 [Xanthobacteraceae bacterium]|nr:hypothetical protein [Xanthobacteraceae bacterium]
MAGDIDVGINSLKPHHEPFLLLSAPTIVPALAEVCQQIIRQHALLSAMICALSVPISYLAVFFVVIDFALRHLPGLFLGIRATAHEHVALLIQQHDANAASIFGGLYNWFAVRHVYISRREFSCHMF